MRNRFSLLPPLVERAQLLRAGRPLRSKHATNVSSPVCLATVPIHVVSNLSHCASFTHALLNFQLNACTERRDALTLNFTVRPPPLVQATLLVLLTTPPPSAYHPSAPSPLVHIVSQIHSSLIVVPPPTSPNHPPPPIPFMLTINSHSCPLCQLRRLHTITLMNTLPVIAPRPNFFPVRA
jgi:hypothetical protein